MSSPIRINKGTGVIVKIDRELNIPRVTFFNPAGPMKTNMPDTMSRKEKATGNPARRNDQTTNEESKDHPPFHVSVPLLHVLPRGLKAEDQAPAGSVSHEPLRGISYELKKQKEEAHGDRQGCTP
jgi:hypothetical protein